MFLVVLMILAISQSLFTFESDLKENEKDDFYVGIAFGGNTSAEAKLLINRIKDYTNLFVLQSGPISKNETAINEICDYAIASGLRIIVYFGWFDTGYPWQLPWLDFAKQRWGDRFLGVYYYDEPGGKQIDYNWSYFFDQVKQMNLSTYQTHTTEIDAYLDQNQPFRSYNDAAQVFVNRIAMDQGLIELKARSITAFTSDYALYWFDYLGGYDVVLSQFGWNQTITQEIALIRGAAQVQNKSWGAIITWKYNQPPYLDTGESVYQQMHMAYKSGAKYVIIFNYPQINDYGIMTDDHFEALERFWNDVTTKNKMVYGSVKAESVLVLPENYGWGMRRSDDRIWYWEHDEESIQIWELSRNLLTQYDLTLDIIYQAPQFQVTSKYTHVYYWNHKL